MFASIWIDWQPFYRRYHNNISEIASDDLVGGLYQRQATNPKDIAYGIWAILRMRGAKDLPEPDYRLHEGQIYWELTVHLMNITRNLRILHMAAAKGLSGTPSWVPDWSSFKSNLWRDLPGFPGTDLYAMSLVSSQEKKRRAMRERTHQRVSINSARNVLTVLARNVGGVCGCISFHMTSESNGSYEKQNHLANLLGMIRWAAWSEAIGCKIKAVDYTPSKELTPISAEVTWPDRRDRMKWGKVYSGSRRKSLKTFFSLWMNGSKVPQWFRKFMAIQIPMCNLMAETKRKICLIRSTAHSKFFLFSCSQDTEINDMLIDVCGLPGYIVMRKLVNSDNSVKIISPTGFTGGCPTTKPANGDDIELESQFVEYNIH
jgi:hypothetical protein